MGEKHFVLIHGACHGAWCWYKVVALLKSGGHKVTALDLLACGVNSKQVSEVRSLEDYSRPLLDLMETLKSDEKVILVGHSYGGATLTLAMESFPDKISVAVFVTASMPGPNLPMSSVRAEYERNGEYMDSKFRFDDGVDHPPTSVLLGPNCLASSFYQLSPPQDLVLAQLLVRPYPVSADEVPVSEENYGSIRRVYIVCGQDLAVRESVQRWMIQNNPPDEVKLIADSDHMPMLSKPLQDVFHYKLKHFYKPSELNHKRCFMEICVHVLSARDTCPGMLVRSDFMGCKSSTLSTKVPPKLKHSTSSAKVLMSAMGLDCL